MFKTLSSKLVFIAVICGMTLVACGDSDEKSKQTGAAGELLSYVPADSPYVLASLEPLPDDVMDKLEPTIDRVLRAYDAVLQEVVVMATAKADGEAGADDEEAQKITAVVRELSALMSLDGLRSIGFERESRVVVYGNGLLPVLRLEVSDGALFEAALARIEASAGEKMALATIAGKSVRYADAEGFKLLIAILDKQVVLSMAPIAFGEAQLASLLGFTAPAANIATAGVLQKLSDKYAFNDYFAGYVDIERIVKTVTGDATGLDVDLMAMQGDAQQLSDDCRAEIHAMAGIAPRVVMGYKDISTTRFSSQAIVELREDIAAGLQTWPAAVPGLGVDRGGLLSFGMSMDLKAVRSFIETRLDAVEKAPFKCEHFAQLQGGVAQMRAGLQQPVPPMVYDFRGFVAVIQDIEGLNMATQTPPTSVEGQFLLAMNNAPALVALGTLMSPDLAGLNLQADGKPVLLDLPQAQMLGQEMYIAMNDTALALSVGDGAQAQLGEMLSAKATENGTFFSFSMDAARYYGFIAEAMATQQADAEDPMSPEFRQAMQEMMLAIAEIYDRISVDVRFSKDGVVMDSVVTLGD